MPQDPINYWEQLQRLEKLIRASEFKAGVIFSFHSLILGLFADRLEYLQQLFQKSAFFLVPFVFWLLFVIISVYFCFRCFTPRMELHYPKNVFFFMDAVRAFGDHEAYARKLMKVCKDEEVLFTQLGQQIHVESKIIDQKFSSVQKSLKFFALSFIFLVTTLLLGLIAL